MAVISCPAVYSRSAKPEIIDEPLSKSAHVQEIVRSLAKPRSMRESESLVRITEVPAEDPKTAKGRYYISRSIKKFEYEFNDYFVEVLQPVDRVEFVRYGEQDRFAATGVRQINSEFEQHLSRIFDSLDFVFKTYRSRKGWSDEFLRDLTLAAVRYMFHSTYINIREKTPEGKMGRIVGTERQLEVPFLNKTRNSSGGQNLNAKGDVERAKLRAESGFIGADLMIPQALRSLPLWRELFPSGRISDSRHPYWGIATVSAPLPRENDKIIYIPTAMETVLRSKYGLYRDDNAGDINRVIEPGNFAIDKAHAHWVAAPLYYHMARLAQSKLTEKDLGSTTRILTYAEKGSVSDIFYQSLGLKVLDVSDSIENNPTSNIWNILGGDKSALEVAYRKRFANTNAPLNFKVFDDFELRSMKTDVTSKLRNARQKFDDEGSLSYNRMFTPEFWRYHSQFDSAFESEK